MAWRAPCGAHPRDQGKTLKWTITWDVSYLVIFFLFHIFSFSQPSLTSTVYKHKKNKNIRRKKDQSQWWDRRRWRTQWMFFISFSRILENFLKLFKSNINPKYFSSLISNLVSILSDKHYKQPNHVNINSKTLTHKISPNPKSQINKHRATNQATKIKQKSTPPLKTLTLKFY